MDFPVLSYRDADGQHNVLLNRETTSLGRLAGQDVVFYEQCVSRQHATIVREGNSYSVVDENSTHGTYLNGSRVERATLHSGDLLHLGSLAGPALRFQFGGVKVHDILARSGTTVELSSSLREFPHLGGTEPEPARQMEQLNWLLSAARQLNEGGAIEDILATLLRLTLQLTGVERGFVFLGQGEDMRLAKGRNAAGEALEEDSTISHRAIRKAIESDAKFSISDTLADDSASAWASVMVNKIRSIYCIPLRKRDPRGHSSELLGLLYLDSQIGTGKLSAVDHQLLDTVSTEGAALLQNALLADAEYKSRRAREELAIAARIHSSLMSIAMPVIPYAELKARSVPCYEIGGDFFDAVALDDCVCVAIADVSGKGVPAAIVAATMQGIIHAQLLSGQSLPDIASLLNRFLCTRNVGKYATMIVLKLFSDGRMEYMNCGHIKPLLIGGDDVRRLEESNLIVGLLPDASYTSTHCTLKSGERILLVTDGVVEAENSAGDAFGDARLVDIAPHQDLNGILDQVSGFQLPNEAQDDCTIVEVAYKRG